MASSRWIMIAAISRRVRHPPTTFVAAGRSGSVAGTNLRPVIRDRFSRIIARMKHVAIALLVLTISSSSFAADYPPAATQPILPPPLPWSGKSRELAVKPHDPWATPCEASGFRRSPDYDETVAWLQKL